MKLSFPPCESPVTVSSTVSPTKYVSLFESTVSVTALAGVENAISPNTAEIWRRMLASPSRALPWLAI